MTSLHYLPLFKKGFARGAVKSLIVAIPFALFVVWELLKDYKYRQVDHLTDGAVVDTFTVGDIAWFGAGGMVYAACLVVLPWAIVCGFIRCFRRTVDSRSEKAHAN